MKLAKKKIFFLTFKSLLNLNKNLKWNELNFKCISYEEPSSESCLDNIKTHYPFPHSVYNVFEVHFLPWLSLCWRNYSLFSFRCFFFCLFFFGKNCKWLVLTDIFFITVGTIWNVACNNNSNNNNKNRFEVTSSFIFKQFLAFFFF